MTLAPVTSAVRAHYDALLAPVYSWMAGGFASACQQQRQLLEKLGAADWKRGTAVDLGAGSGFQTLPLAEWGFQVLAVDFCPRLLRELEEHTAGCADRVRTVETDLLTFSEQLGDQRPALILCMGDTLSHLATLSKVDQLFAEVARTLAPLGRFVLTFRDLLSTTLTDTERFMLLRQDEQRILTCFLEYSDEHVRVHDLLHERHPDGWQLRTSSYPKLRLNSDRVSSRLAGAGLAILRNSTSEDGLVTLVAQKPKSSA